VIFVFLLEIDDEAVDGDETSCERNENEHPNRLCRWLLTPLLGGGSTINRGVAAVL
jgi:hypothetical protein